jgi:hypothetical protein
MNKKTGYKIVHVKNRLAELIHLPGGISREEAVDAAIRHVESLRDDYVKLIPDEIAALEAIVGDGGEISAPEIDRALDRAARLLSLSGTFGYSLLDAVVKCFCDLGMLMIEYGITSAAPLEVHLRAMRLVCPGSPALVEAEAKDILDELAKIHAHFKAV